MAQLKIGVIGAGKMGIQHARVAARAGELSQLCALIDRSEATLEAAAKEFPTVPRFTSLADALRAGPLDVVHVCTPQGTHFRVALEAIERGCHVLVEKPFTRTSEEAGLLIQAARKAGVSVCAGHQLLFEPAYHQLVEYLPILGDIVHIESYFAFAPTRGTRTGESALNAEDQLIDILPHPVYLLLGVLDAAAPESPMEMGEVSLGSAGTIHALVRRGGVTATLVVTLSGRPVESTVRVVGTNGEVVADLVRGIVRHQFGPGRSMIDKVAAPYRQATQMVFRSTRVLLKRLLERKRDYPSLTELIRSWYTSIHADPTAPAIPVQSILETVATCEAISARTGLGTAQPTLAASAQRQPAAGRKILVTGGTGWLGTEVVRKLAASGARVVALSRRLPASWQRVSGVSYATLDLANETSLADHTDATCVVHCAAETVGGQAAHERNSIRATDNLLAAMQRAGIQNLVHVSSLAVVQPTQKPMSEDAPLIGDSLAFGAYSWGKAESEKRVESAEGINACIIRPAAIIDSRRFVPPGKLGKRVGPMFVAIGGYNEPLGVVELDWTADAVAWSALHFEEAPKIINLFDPDLPTRGELVQRLRATDPSLRVVRIRRPVLWFLGLVTVALQRVLKPSRTPVDVRKVFARQSYDTSLSRKLQQQVRADAAKPAAGVKPVVEYKLEG